jgi:hypothetical protein
MIMKSRKEIIKAYNEELFKVYKEEHLQSLQDENYTYAGENIIAINVGAVSMAGRSGLYDRQVEVYNKLKLDRGTKNPNQMQMELISVTADLKFRVGTLYLYHPFITVLEKSYRVIDGKKFHRYNQKLEDARFNRELPVAFECLYKFWQRLGDYLCSFFPEFLLDKRGLVYFQQTFQYIHDHFPALEASPHYQWLWQFQQDTYPVFNKHRKFFVHHAGYDSDYIKKFLEAHAQDDAAINALDAERNNWLPYLKEQSTLCNDGYLEMMKFLNHLQITRNEDGDFNYTLIK